jgi:hypothetical protein
LFQRRKASNVASTLHKEANRHGYLLICQKCRREGESDIQFSCCAPCAKDHFDILHRKSDLFYITLEKLKLAYDNKRDFAKIFQEFLDVRCHLCHRLFQNRKDRDLHADDVCFTRGLLQCEFYGESLNSGQDSFQKTQDLQSQQNYNRDFLKGQINLIVNELRSEQLQHKFPTRELKQQNLQSNLSIYKFLNQQVFSILDVVAADKTKSKNKKNKKRKNSSKIATWTDLGMPPKETKNVFK